MSSSILGIFCSNFATTCGDFDKCLFATLVVESSVEIHFIYVCCRVLT